MYSFGRSSGRTTLVFSVLMLAATIAGAADWDPAPVAGSEEVGDKTRVPLRHDSASTASCRGFYFDSPQHGAVDTPSAGFIGRRSQPLDSALIANSPNAISIGIESGSHDVAGYTQCLASTSVWQQCTPPPSPPCGTCSHANDRAWPGTSSNNAREASDASRRSTPK